MMKNGMSMKIEQTKDNKFGQNNMAFMYLFK